MKRILATAVLTGGLLFGATPLALAADDSGTAPDTSIQVGVTIPDLGSPTTELTNAQLRWSLNNESGAGSYVGGCNFLMAGKPAGTGNTGGSSIWADGSNYRATSGDARIERPVGDSGTKVTADWSSRCTDRDGETVTTANGRVTEQQVVIDGGTGTMDREAGTAQIQWTGTFTAVFYGGMSYWWATDPVLTVQADGTATLTATAGGYGTSMNDASQWRALASAKVDLAKMSSVTWVDKGLSSRPDYRGVSMTAPSGSAAQVRTGDDWGSFPQSFVDFHADTGQAAYWYSTGGAADSRKPATTVYVNYDANDPQTGGTDERSANTDADGSGGVGVETFGTADGGSGSGGSGSGSVAAATVADALTVPTAATQTVAQAQPDLIPALVPAAPAGQRAAWGLAGLLLACSGTVIGFRTGWLVLPWR